MKASLYEENFKLHSENARLRKQLEQLESSLGIDKLRAQFDAEIKKQLHREEKLRKESERYHRLWQDAVSELRSKGDVIDLLIQLEDLQKLCDQLREEISSLTMENADLKNKCEHLIHQMHRDYENSSLPSSAKPNHKKIKNSRKPTTRTPGAQSGHPGHKRPHLEPTDFQVLPVPDSILDNPDYYLTGRLITKQLIDVVVSTRVTEYSTPEYRNRLTGSRGHAPFPAGVTNDTNYGENIKALAFLLKDYCNVSIDKTRELIEGITDGKVLLSKGAVAGLTQKFSASTETERNRIFQRLLQYPVMYSDATNARVNGKSSFVIVCANENEMLYFFREHKGHEGIKGTPVEQYQQLLVHDHDKTYYNYGTDHQECLAHVLRYLQDSIDNEPHLSWNSQMKEFISSMIHETKDNRTGLSDPQIEAYYSRYDAILKLGQSEYQTSPPDKYYRDGFNLLKRMIAYRENHLLFLTHPEIDYTDNLSERALRKYKRKQKQAVSFRSNNSVEFLCNAMSIIETHRLQGANIYNTVREVFLPTTNPSASCIN